MAAAAEFDFENGRNVDRYTQELRRTAHHSHRLHRPWAACFGFHHAPPEVARYQLAQGKSQRKSVLPWQNIKDRDMSTREIGTLLTHCH
jgi:hypothetical protein